MKLFSIYTLIIAPGHCGSLQSSTMQNSEFQQTAVQVSRAIQCYAVRCSAVQSSGVQFRAVKGILMQQIAVQLRIVPLGKVLYSEEQCSVMRLSKYHHLIWHITFCMDLAALFSVFSDEWWLYHWDISNLKDFFNRLIGSKVTAIFLDIFF